MAAFSGALGLGGLDIVMQGQCSGRRLGMDGFVSFQAHVWKEAQYIEANMIEMERHILKLLIILITLPRLPTYILVIPAR